MDSRGSAPGVARLHLADGVPLLRPEEQVFTAMLDGWRNQQLARNLAFSTIEGRERAVRAFAVHAEAFP
jgi:integrase/recombinase XerC